MNSTGYDVARIRACFPALRAGAAHFDGPGGTQVPQAVADAVSVALTTPMANRGVVTAAERNAEDTVRAARMAMGDLLDADPRGIVFGRSATALTFELARAVSRGWRPGDDIVVSRLDHDANIRPWLLAAEHAGIDVRWAEFDPATGDLDVDAVAKVVSSRTRLVAVTAASNLLGTRPQVRLLADLAHRHGALLHVDAVHHVPHLATSLAEFGADSLVCSPYKFLGPHCGVLAADPRRLEGLHPLKLLPSPDLVPERFELGTLPYELLAGVSAAVDFLADLVPQDHDLTRRARLVTSFAALAAHEDGLITVLEEGLDRLGVHRYGRAAARTPTVLFEVPGVDSQQVYRDLAERGVNAPAGSFYALEASRALGLGDTGAVRAGLAPYSDAEDVDRLLSGLADLIPGRPARSRA